MLFVYYCGSGAPHNYSLQLEIPKWNLSMESVCNNVIELYCGEHHQLWTPLPLLHIFHVGLVLVVGVRCGEVAEGEEAIETDTTGRL